MTDPALVLADMLAAACDDLPYPMRRRHAAQIAQLVVDHLAVAGYEIVQVGDPRVRVTPTCDDGTCQ